MTTARFDVDIDAVADLKHSLGAKTDADLIERALKLARYSVENAKNGILTIKTPDGGEKTLNLTS